MPVGDDRDDDHDDDRDGGPAGAGGIAGAATVRALVLGVVLVGAAGLLVELLLAGHVEDWTQWIPLVVLAATLVLVPLVHRRPSPATLRTFGVVMAAAVAAGVAGVALHLWGNLEFEREQDPAARGLPLLWTALTGGVPALAPGALAQLGLLGLACIFRHPAWRRPRRPAPTQPSPR